MEQVVNFQDVIKSSFIETELVNNLTSYTVFSNLLVSFLIGAFIFFMYRVTFQGVLYTRSFNVSLIMMSLITTLVIMTISSNIILSLGMVGALSIVRFRTAIKDSMDIVFMFWAISIGIANGAGFYHVSIIGSTVIGFILYVMNFYKTTNLPYLLIVNFLPKSETLVNDALKSVKKLNIKSKQISDGNIEMTVEMRLKDNDTTIVNKISNILGVKNSVLIKYDGDYVS